MLSHFFKNKILAALAISFAILIVTTSLNLLGIFQSFHNQFANSLYTIDDPSEEIIIIAVDDKSTEPYPVGLGRFSQWSRERFTELLTILEQENPKVITVDFIFHTPSTTVPQEKFFEAMDNADASETNSKRLEVYENFIYTFSSSINHPIDDQLAKKFQSLSSLVLAAAITPEGLTEPLSKFAKNATIGIANNPIDESGFLRTSIPYFQVSDQQYDNLSVATVKKYLNTNQLNLPLKDNEMLVNFFGNPGAYKRISFIDVINQQFSAETFQDKIVLIGPIVNKEIHDEHFTPKSTSIPMPGVEFRANEIQTILEGKFLKNQGFVSQIITILILTSGLTIALNYLGILTSILLSLTAIATYYAAAHFFYHQGLILNMIYPFIAIILAYLGSWVYKYFIADKDKRQITGAFGRYVSEKLVKLISKNPEMVKLGGEKRVVTVFFSDLKDSTAISEKTEITAWVSQLNEYFTVMENIAKKHNGTIDKFEGDAIMAFWNAPIPDPQHITNAYNAALEMQTALQSLNVKWQKEGRPMIEIRIGINTGEALVGNFGSKNRFDYTTMGDTVNTASRLESSANKTYGTNFLISGADPETLKKYLFRHIDTVILPGKKDPVQLFEIISAISQATPEQTNLATIYANGLKAYQAKNFQVAASEFQKLPDDKPSRIMLARCQALQRGEKIQQLDEQMNFHIFSK